MGMGKVQEGASEICREESEMTKQQAIWTLIDCRRLLIDGLVSVQKDYITEAFDMAIDALKYLEAMKGENHE